jgi:hypothetical protein
MRALPISGFEGLYEITDEGSVISLPKTWRSGSGRISSKMHTVMNSTLAGRGYPSVQLRKNGKSMRKHIHRLVAEHFLPRIDGLEVVNHIDGDKTNNRTENLEWCTPSQNRKHAWRIGLNKMAESERQRLANLNKSRARLSTDDAMKIRARHQNGERVRDIVKDYPSFSYSYIWDVATENRRQPTAES